ncbi:MAG TPA: DUF1127 domain-containing protein [Burkholderiales bacterium]|jgi:uncharacterized protein YjiS (DUF1127 family)|nr:DUF1127 domain-containing protein [Burkholderiales bacterium]
MNGAERISYPFVEIVAVMLAAAWEKAREAMRLYAEARRRGAAARELERLSDHMLRDIGLHRSQIGAALREQRPWS